MISKRKRRTLWESWFAWHPIKAKIISTDDPSARWTYLQGDDAAWIWFETVDRRQNNGRLEYKVRRRVLSDAEKLELSSMP